MASLGNRSQTPNPAVSMAKKTSSFRRSKVWVMSIPIHDGNAHAGNTDHRRRAANAHPDMRSHQDGVCGQVRGDGPRRFRRDGLSRRVVADHAPVDGLRRAVRAVKLKLIDRGIVGVRARKLAPRSVLVAVPAPSLVIICTFVSPLSQPMPTRFSKARRVHIRKGPPWRGSRRKSPRHWPYKTPVDGPQTMRDENPPGAPAVRPIRTAFCDPRTPATAVVAATVTWQRSRRFMVKKFVVAMAAAANVPVFVRGTPRPPPSSCWPPA